MEVALAISVVSGAAAVAAAVWARESAKAANRSAAATERAADAQENAVETARAALVLERERAGPERYRAIESVAPTIDLVKVGDSEFMLAESGPLLGEVLNIGPGDAVIASAAMELWGREYSGLPGRANLEPRMSVQLQFRDETMIDAARRADGLALVVEYEDAASPYRARARWKILRNGSDSRGRPKWHARHDGVERLDRPGAS
jgi:hypothetical protein